jgi:hypothetical protein
MKPKQYFLEPNISKQKQYEALRAFYVEGLPANEVAQEFGYSPLYFKKMRSEFVQQLNKEENPFFQTLKTGPQKRFTDEIVIEKMIILRKQNYSIQDIRMVLESEGYTISLDAINDILKAEGFAPLLRRTKAEKLGIKIPSKICSPQSCSLIVRDEIFFTETGAGPLIFLPLIDKLGIVSAILKANFPSTKKLDSVSSIMSFLALKIVGKQRLSHDETWNLDRALGLFAGRNVLPKSATLSSYSYRVKRSQNRKFLVELNQIFSDTEMESGDFNLYFKTIPHWGDASVLEKNWSGLHSKTMKSVLALIVQDPSTSYLSYTNAEIKHQDQHEVVIEFVDFWIKSRGVAPKMLIFDSKLTTYENLDKLNQSPQQIKFLTLRRRNKHLLKTVEKISQWQSIKVKGKNRKHQIIKTFDSTCQINKYQGDLRQIILTDHGHLKPTFMITNDFDASVQDLVKKYARRWLVEQEIAEQIAFFHLNQLGSSIVVKVDFDLTMSLLTHNLYRVLSKDLPGFEQCTVPTLYRKFIENGARIQIEGDMITVFLKKKSHLPILFELPWLNKNTHLSWLELNIQFSVDTTS